MGLGERELSRGKFLGSLVGCSFALFLHRSGHAPAAAVVLTVALSLLVVAVLAPRLSARIDRGLAIFSGWVGAALSFVLLSLSFVLVVVPVNLGLRLAGRRPLTLGSDPSSATYWERVPSSDGLYARTYLVEPRRPAGVSPAVFAFAALGALAVVGIGNAFWGQHLRRTAEVRSVRRELAAELEKPALRDSRGWFGRYLTESRAASAKRYVPFIGWRHRDYAGETLHVEEGLRRTVPAGAAAAPELAMFGGSAMWGVGARDDHTIASEVARMLAAEGRAAHVVNYSEPGYTLWQDVMLFAQQLALGHRPRLATFYDGINELMVQISEGPSTELTHFNAAELSEQLHERKLDLVSTLRGNNGLAIFLSELRHPIEVPANYPMPRPAEAYASPAARDYRAAMSLAKALSTQYGVAVAFFWQPALCSRNPPNPGEAEVRASLTHLREQCAAYAALTAAVDQPGLHRLDQVFDDRKEPLYFDYVHVNEAGNRIVAEHMMPALLAAYDARAPEAIWP